MTSWYNTEVVYESEHSLVYRGRRSDDSSPVILKVLKHSYPPPERIAWFKREYELVRSLQLPGVIKAYDLDNDQNRWVILLEDIGGESLARLQIAGRMELAEFLTLAIQVTEILEQVHRHNVMHKDINPSNIILNPQTGEVQLIDFGISTRLSRENPTFRNPEVLEGTPAYLSPEQTGRMNRAMDYRTDFYSLGATFYELLTGQVPFPTADILELVHCHIARSPTPPEALDPRIPAPVSAIILKLLAKDAENRYQSAYGLKADLQECLHQWQATGQIAPFPLGRHDRSDRFQLPQKLYGREQEIALLLAAFERIGQGGRELMLVTGYAGIGKTALVHEVYKPLTRQRGYFLAGKFDQLQRNIPYAALLAAFRALMRQLLTESEADIAAWRARLMAALGPNAQVIVEVIPEVALIVGPQPAVPTLGTAESQNRFNLVFQNFIGVFAASEHPLVLFLDDLQWADGASLNLLRLLMTASESQYLFIIGAYRDNEVGGAHPLALALDEIQRTQAPVSRIALAPLDLPNVVQLLVDTFACTAETAAPLAGLVLAKTGGNPFFLSEFLKSLYAETLLNFDAARGWQWDLERIQAHAITDNLVDLLAGKVQQLPPATRHVVQLAACIGNRFDLSTLALVAERPPHLTARDLWQALVEGLIVPLSDAYKLIELEVPGLAEAIVVEYMFAHDRVQQAVYSLIPTERRPALHAQVGHLLLRNTRPDQRERRIFDIVNQLNLGRAAPDLSAERDELAALNLAAGRQAIGSAAYEPAFRYLQTGIDLLGQEGWRRQYDLALALHVEAAEAAYLSGQLDQMDKLNTVVLRSAQHMLDKVRVYEVLLQALMAQNRFLESVQTGLPVLRPLGVHLPERPGQLQTVQGLIKTKLALAGKSFEALRNLPEMTGQNQLAAMRILSRIASAAYLGQPALLPSVVFTLVRLSITHGNAPVSAFGYVAYGLISCSIGEIDSGYQFGKLAMDLVERFRARDLHTRIFTTFYAFIKPWKDHWRDSLRPLADEYQDGLETGDFEYAGYAAHIYCYCSLYTGAELVELEQTTAKYTESLGQLQIETSRGYNQLLHQTMLNLTGRSDDPCRLIGESYDERDMLPRHVAARDEFAIFILYHYKLMLLFLFEDFRQAVEYAAQAERHLNAAPSTIHVAQLAFFGALARLARCSSVGMIARRRLLRKVAASQRQLKRWARHAPMNHLHKWYLVAAERARVLGQAATAREHYDRAIALAQQHGYLNDEALAHELAARFYLERGQRQLAQTYLRDAQYAYLRWGALAKVRALERRYQQLLGPAEQRRAEFSAGRTAPLTITNSTTATRLDATSVLKASQALSGEIDLNKLLARLMRVVIENAGAQTGYLLLDQHGEWLIEAQGTIDQEYVMVRQSIPLHTSVPVAPLIPATIIHYVARTRESVVLADAAREGPFTNDPVVAARQPRSVLCAPLINQGKLTGILYLENNLTTGAFTAERLQVLNLLSSQVAISIENARLYADLQASEEKYRTVFEDSKETIFITSAASQIIDMNPAGLNLFGYTGEELRHLNAEALYADPEDRRRFWQQIARDGMVRDYAVLGRKKDGTTIDIVVTATVRRDQDGAVLGFQGIVRDITAQKRAEQERLRLTAMERELTVARDMQQSLLPPPKPDWAGLDVVCFNTPAREVGGDLYIYHTFDRSSDSMPERRYAIAVGDVSGKGMPAALLMAVSLASFRSIIRQGLGPSQLLAEMNHALADYTHTTRQNCALVYVELTADRGIAPVGQQADHAGYTLRVANAGCVPPLIRHRDGSIEWIAVAGMPLGVDLASSMGYPEVTLRLAKGDTVILTSDGILESNNAQRELFGFERLERAVASAPAAGAAAILAHIQAEVTAFVGTVEPHDDLTIVVVQL